MTIPRRARRYMRAASTWAHCAKRATDAAQHGPPYLVHWYRDVVRESTLESLRNAACAVALINRRRDIRRDHAARKERRGW